MHKVGLHLVKVAAHLDCLRLELRDAGSIHVLGMSMIAGSWLIWLKIVRSAEGADVISRISCHTRSNC